MPFGRVMATAVRRRPTVAASAGLTITDRGLGSIDSNSSAVTTETSPSFAPAAGSLLVMILSSSFTGTTPTFAASDTFSGTGAWTEIAATFSRIRVSIFYAKAGATPGTGTMTMTRSAATLAGGWSTNFLEITGQAAVPIGATGSIANNTGSSTMSITLSGVPAATSLVIGGTYDNNSSGSTTQPTGWTELRDTSFTTFAARSESAYKLGSAAQTFSWTGLSGLTGGKAAVAAEIVAA